MNIFKSIKLLFKIFPGNYHLKTASYFQVFPLSRQIVGMDLVWADGMKMIINWEQMDKK